MANDETNDEMNSVALNDGETNTNAMGSSFVPTQEITFAPRNLYTSSSCAFTLSAPSTDDGHSTDDENFPRLARPPHHRQGRVSAAALRAKRRKKQRVCEVKKLTAYTTKMVQRWRFISIAVTLFFGVAVSISIYFVLQTNQEYYCNQSYVTVTEGIAESTWHFANHLMVASQMMANLVLAAAQTTSQTFPNVTVPSVWEVQAMQAREIANVEQIAWIPLVESDKAETWGSYSDTHDGWIDQSRQTIAHAVEADTETVTTRKLSNSKGIVPFAYEWSYDGERIPATTSPYVAPVWQVSPPPGEQQQNGSLVNFNILSVTAFTSMPSVLSQLKESVFSATVDHEIFVDLHQPLYPNTTTTAAATSADMFNLQSYFVQPVLLPAAYKIASTSDPATLVGMITMLLPWDRYLKTLSRPGVNGIYCILQNSCGESFTYMLNDNEATFVGKGDLHDTRFEGTRTVIPIAGKRNASDTTSFSNVAIAASNGADCDYYLVVYGSATTYMAMPSSLPVILALSWAVLCAFVALAIARFDQFMRKRIDIIETTAVQSSALLSTLFPTNVAKRLFAEEKNRSLLSNKGRLKCYLDEVDDGSSRRNKKKKNQHTFINRFVGRPIADFFPDTSVLFADIAGFTAWSSQRQPEQVFRLLETLYRAFDIIAKSNRVYKVETIGDCYVAVTGLPDPRRDHAVAMARFAREIVDKMKVLVKKLELILGPDTVELQLRVGIHSGPVTGGVLRGDRSRFQLFGDTMNTASRMESTSKPGKIQLSQETTDLLIAAGKFHWIELRESTIVAKGKGELQTYWLTPNTCGEASCSDDTGNEHAIVVGAPPLDKFAEIAADRMERLIEWNTDCLIQLLKEMVAKRASLEIESEQITTNERHFTRNGETVINEVKDIISFPPVDRHPPNEVVSPDEIELFPVVVDQMYDFVANIAGLYNSENPFHNFEHASQVVMSMIKLLSCIVAPTTASGEGKQMNGQKAINDHTYGITSDPLTQFACIFAALIHDVDHSGVPNAQLIIEDSPIAEFYKGKSIAEQNAVDLAWQLFMDDAYTELREMIYANDDELRRFRQIIVNSVMATDIFDTELKGLRHARWQKAFNRRLFSDDSPKDAMNRKATAVIEHLVQASDNSYAMQNWHVYRKWSEQLFMECYKAYKEGRVDENPADGWYEKELGFFDFSVIPLAKKLKDCGVLGVSSDEYLDHALKNRVEWEEKGHEVVHELVETARKEYGL